MKTCNFTPVSKVISIINSCETLTQLKSCKKLIKNYTEQLKFKGVINYNEVERYLFTKYDIVNMKLENIQTKPIEKKKKRECKKKIKETVLVNN
jgi:hypothetical protein